MGHRKTLHPMVALLVVAVFAGVFLTIGWVFYNTGLENVALGEESLEWPHVEGKVISSRVNVSKGTGTKQDSYTPMVTYTFTVNGSAYEGDQVAFGALYDGRTAGQTVSRYQKGKTVKVFYDPEDPNVSVLEPGAEQASNLYHAFGLIFLIFGSLVAALLIPLTFRAIRGKSPGAK